MTSFVHLKLNKRLLSALQKSGFEEANGLQQKIFPRIRGGESFWTISPSGSGKTTSIIIAALQKVNHLEEIAPRALILVPDIEAGEQLIDQFHILNTNRDLRILGLFAGPSLESQVLELTDGVDIVIATPDRARAAYLKLGLNLNKLLLFIVDDADIIVKNGLQLPTIEIARGIRKAQFLIFSEVNHPRLYKMVETILEVPTIIEFDPIQDKSVQAIDQLLYQVPNFKTKLNLVKLLIEDIEVFEQAIILVQSKFTAETVYKTLIECRPNEVCLVNNAEEMAQLSNDNDGKYNIYILEQNIYQEGIFKTINNLLNFDIPQNLEIYKNSVLLLNKPSTDKLVLNFCTDLELTDIKKIEQEIGKKMHLMDLPDDLYIEKEPLKKKNKSHKIEEENVGTAFHSKKPSNAKTHNYSAREKAKLSGKIISKKHD